VIGGVVLALVMASLGGARPEAGGLVRWPYHSNGRFVATNSVPAPWDSVIVAVIVLAAWLAGVRAGRQHLARSPVTEGESRPGRSQR